MGIRQHKVIQNEVGMTPGLLGSSLVRVDPCSSVFIRGLIFLG